MLYLFVTLPFIVTAWLLYSSRDMLLAASRWILRRRYEIRLEGDFQFEDKKNYLIIPNHPAIVDPMILVTELHHAGLDICPLVDESFFSNRLARHILALLNAVRVPDFRKSNFRPFLKAYPTYKSSARRAKALSYSILALLTAGENVLLYPSGHITADGREALGNRQLAYNAISQLPDGVEVVAIRMRGLFGSMWSRAGGTPAPPLVRTLVKAIFLWPLSFFRGKRNVHIYAENVTQKVVEWSKASRGEFDKRLESWYNADLEMKGLVVETPT